MVLSGSTAVVQSPRCLHRDHEPIRDTCGTWTVEGMRSDARIGSRPQILAPRRNWYYALGCYRHLLHLSSDVGGPTQAAVPSRTWDSVRDLVLFQAQSRNHVHGNRVAPWSVLQRTVGYEFHLNEHVLHFVGLCVLLPWLVGFRPLRTVFLLSLIMAW